MSSGCGLYNWLCLTWSNCWHHEYFFIIRYKFSRFCTLLSCLWNTLYWQWRLVSQVTCCVVYIYIYIYICVCVCVCVCHRVVIYKVCSRGSVTVMHSLHKFRYLLSLQSRPLQSKVIKLRHLPFKICKQNYIPDILESLFWLWGLCIIMALPQV
jgi:hypothetical protein